MTDPQDDAWDAYDRAAAQRLRVVIETEYGDPRRTVAAIFHEGARADVEAAVRADEREKVQVLLAAARETERDLAWFSFSGRGDSMLTLSDVLPTTEGALNRIRTALAAFAGYPAPGVSSRPATDETEEA